MATIRIDNTTPLIATHPLDVVKEELAARGISKKEFADRLGLKASNLSRMFREKQAITVPFAEKLEEQLGIKTSFWLNMQDKYCKDVKAIEHRDENERLAISEEIMLASLLNLKKLYARLDVNANLYVQDKLDILKKALDIDISAIPVYISAQRGNYKRSEVLSVDDKNMNTWKVLAFMSSRKNVPEVCFERGNAKKAAMDIAKEVHKGNISEDEIKSILNSYGISYSVVEKLEHTPIDGYSTWTGKYPSVVTTHRYNDMSCLIFNIMHELGHIELHMDYSSNNSFIAEDGTYSCNDPREVEANRFAEDMLIDRSLWNGIMKNARVKGILFSNIVRELKTISKENHLDFGIVSWRYKHDTRMYAINGLKSNPIH